MAKTYQLVAMKPAMTAATTIGWKSAANSTREAVGALGADHAHPAPDAEERVGELGRRLRAVRVTQHPQGTKTVVDQEGDVSGLDVELPTSPDLVLDLLDAPPPVDRLEDRVQRWRELEDLTVRPPDEPRRLAISRTLEAAEQLEVGRRGRNGPEGLPRGETLRSRFSGMDRQHHAITG